jgi:hypothetical protein
VPAAHARAVPVGDRVEHGDPRFCRGRVSPINITKDTNPAEGMSTAHKSRAATTRGPRNRVSFRPAETFRARTGAVEVDYGEAVAGRDAPGQTVDFWPALIVVGVVMLVGLIVVAAVVSARRERRRREALRQWAAWYGWTYAERPAVEWWSRLPGRDRRGVSLMLSGVVDGYPVSVGEYSYTETRTSTTYAAGGTSTSTSSTTHRFVVVVVRLPRPGPSVEVQPRHGLSKLGRAIFGDGATALGYQLFDRAFRIVTKDAAAARYVVGPSLAAEHVAGRVPSWSLRGAELLTSDRGRLDDPARIPALVAPLIRVADRLGR